jgi:hypothetical protein
MLVASKAQISEFGIVIHEGSITVATVAVANHMTSYFPSDKIHHTKSWIIQPLNVVENHSQFKTLLDFGLTTAVGEPSQ